MFPHLGTGPSVLVDSRKGELVRIQSGTPIVLNRGSKVDEKKVLGAMGTLESKLRFAMASLTARWL